MRPTRAEIDLDAIAHNVGVLAALADPAQLCAVVKADGYGHGAVEVARAALDAGATWLGVALCEEGRELREAGLDAPILLLSEPSPAEMDAAVTEHLRPTVYTRDGVLALADAARRAAEPVPVHLKINTGMYRVGAPADQAVALAELVRDSPGLGLEAVWSHCPVADEPDNPYTGEQVERLRAVLDELDRDGLHPPMVHLANSAALICQPDTAFDLVRAGIAVYGVAPSPALAGRADLQPAMRLVSEVCLVQRVPAGAGVSYGHRWHAERDTTIATVPIGYADGVARRWFEEGGCVLVGGRRRPLAGVVTMDQLMVDCGEDEVAAGDEVVLIGRQGDEELTAEEWADTLGTIGYEIVSRIGPRVTRYHLAS